ncbi:hypothetical protein SODALDRAFT_338468 [Sodiomyces alkalinus F11]|uniref:Uncharacterized protein n=1 Tax=Sodiomyces alkalinus (strain CBS 110278 / VKM F-3762 / F11) TaxID=1314773 RepID=A0A3N2Q268_SODAK|nr:hypothetical protein SODALDRAFT_338468 [Sodiomyces alkalinus F11]ROT40854.1 hypothetical protein SODALDRAFT_338468 [Sodiomyces alkalinus F11]
MPHSKNDLHHRHKSTGHLLAASRTTGLQVTAKRTAFGDVSNVVKKLAPGQGGVALSKGKVYDVSHKENIPDPSYGFAKPAQRNALPPTSKKQHPAPAQNKLAVRNDEQAGSKYFADDRSRTKSSSRPNTAESLPARTSLAPLPLVTNSSYPTSCTLLSEEDIEESMSQIRARDRDHLIQPSASDENRKSIIDLIAPSTLQPRQHKSQPQLKQSLARDLRRTQSRLVISQTAESREQEDDKHFDDVTEAAYEDALEDFLDEQCQAPITENHKPENRNADAVEQTGQNKEGPPGISSAPMSVPGDLTQPKLAASFPEQSTGVAATSYEECWDELEEEEDLCDDQGYSTAHSYRSRGELTTGGVTTILAPRVTDNVQKELDAARAYVEGHQTIEDVEDEAWDVSMVAEYGDDIFGYLRELEMKMLPDPHYMDNQAEIQWSMRSVLMDWLIQVHSRFSLLPETLYLTVNYIDRFLSYKTVSIGKLQLVGATALLIASKYEEINCPSLEEVVFMVDGTYAVEEILKAERFMLSMLNFELGWPGPMSFLRRISKADDYDLETRTLAKYFLEVTIMDERFVASPPSYLAAGAHCLSRLIMRKGDWSQGHVHYSGYTWSQLRTLVQMLLECCHDPRKHHSAVLDKYLDNRYKRAAEYVQEELRKGFTLPRRQSAGPRPSLFDLAGLDRDYYSAVQQSASVC